MNFLETLLVAFFLWFLFDPSGFGESVRAMMDEVQICDATDRGEK